MPSSGSPDQIGDLWYASQATRYTLYAERFVSGVVQSGALRCPSAHAVP
jgi:hypothetical protein